MPEEEKRNNSKTTKKKESKYKEVDYKSHKRRTKQNFLRTKNYSQSKKEHKLM